MKSILLFLAFSFAGEIILGQDLIVTSLDDSIACKILGIHGNDMVYKVQENGKMNEKSISLSEMKYYAYSFYKAEKQKNKTELTNISYPRVRIAFSGGFGFCMANQFQIPLNIDYKENGLNSGFQFAGDFSAYFNRVLGLGFKVGIYKSGKEKTDDFSNNIMVTYAAPQLCLRSFSQNRNGMLFFAISMGYAAFSDKAEHMLSYNFKGNSFAWGLDLGYEWSVSENISFGIEISTLGGKIKKLHSNGTSAVVTLDLEEEKWERLGRVDASAGIRFNF